MHPARRRADRHGRSLACLALAWALAASMLAGCGALPGDDERVPEVDLAFEQYTLDNGLEVILREDERLPIAAVNLWYHVGPANEVEGRTGFAHLFEHMMFQGSGHVGEDAFLAHLEAAGASFVNGTTSFDRTNYMEDVPSNQLELALWLESDRMGFLLDSLDQGMLSNQQSVVRNERRQSRETAPYGLSDEALYELLFPEEHPYHANVIGSHEDIQAAGLDDVRDFFTRYYVPNNASLAIVGDIDIAATKALVEKYFGSISRGPEVPQVQVVAPQITQERHRTVTDQVELPRVAAAWLTPSAFAPGDAEADVTARLLGGGKASRLYEALVHEAGIAQSVSAYQQSLSHGSVFQIEATAKPGHSAEELEAAIQTELDALAAEGPTAQELEAAKTGSRSDIISSLENLNGVADRLNLYNHYLGDPGYLNRDLQRYSDVEAQGVKRFAAEQLRDDRRVVVHTIPGEKVIPPEPPTPPTPPEAVTARTPSAEPWRNAIPQPGPASAVSLPSAKRFELDNGLPVYLVESHNLPLVTASLASRSGSAADPPQRPGLAGFSAAMLDEGTQTRDALGIARELEALGASLDTDSTRNGSSVVVQALTPQMGEAMTVMSDVVRAPAFPPSEIDRVRSERLVDLQQQRDDPSRIAVSVMWRDLYGDSHPYGHIQLGTEEALSTISRENLLAFYRDSFTPRNTALTLVGDLTESEARTLANDAFGGWSGGGADAPRPGPPAPAAERVLVVDKPGSPQTALVLAQPGVARSDPDFEKLSVMNEILGGAFSSRINLNLRERNGYSYGAFSEVSPNRGVGPILLRTSVETQFTGASIRELLSEVAAIQEAPISAAELRLARESLSQSLPARFGTGRDTVRAIGELYLFDLAPNYYQELPSVLAAIDAGDVQAAARAHLRPGDMKVIAVGDRAQIDAQLAALSLGPLGYRTADGAPVAP